MSRFAPFVVSHVAVGRTGLYRAADVPLRCLIPELAFTDGICRAHREIDTENGLVNTALFLKPGKMDRVDAEASVIDGDQRRVLETVALDTVLPNILNQQKVEYAMPWL